MITIDRDLVRTPSRSYAVAKIDSVFIEKGMKGPILFAVGVALALASAFFVLAMLGGAGAVGAVPAIIFGFLALGAINEGRPTVYRLNFSTDGGRVMAFQSDDPDAVIDLRHRIEAAIAAR